MAVPTNDTYTAASGSAIYGGMAAPGASPSGSSTVNYSAAEVNAGWMGSLSTTKLAGRLSIYAGYGYWVGYITGTDALLTAFQYASTTPAGMIEVSVDGGAFTTAPMSGAQYVLFAGLSHAKRLVMIRVNSGYGGNGNVSTSGTVLTVTGATPSVTTPSWWVQPNDGSSNALSAAATTAAFTDFSPVRVKTAGGPAASNVPMVVVKGGFSRLFVAGHYRYVYVSVDGAAPTRYAAPRAGLPTNVNSQCIVIDGLSGVHTYYVWGTDNITSLGGHFAVGAETARSPVAATRKLVQYGDSITFGVGATSAGEVEVLRVAAALGMAASTSGISGQTIAQILARIPSDAGALTPTSADVAVLASGRNDCNGLTAMTAQHVTDYTASINALLAAGFGKVICRGVLPDVSGNWSGFNASMQSLVSGLANPAVVYVDPASWITGLTWSDGTHPNDNGYTVLAGYAQAAYSALI